MNNRRLISALCFLLSALAVSAADVVFNLRDLTSGAVANRKVLIAPSWLNPSNAIGALDKWMYRSDTNGSFTITNMVPGIYNCEIQSPPARTPFSILVVDTNATLAAHDLLIVATNRTESPDSYAWSTTASDARYAMAGEGGGSADISGGTFTNVGIYGASLYTTFLSAGYPVVDASFMALKDADGYNSILWNSRSLIGWDGYETLNYGQKEMYGTWTVTSNLTANNFILSTPRWVDALASGMNLAPSPTQAPSLEDLPGSSITKGMGYDHGDIGYFTIQSPHVIASTNATFPDVYYEPHIHVSPTTVASGTNITFRMEWQTATVFGNFTNVTTLLRTNRVTVTNINNHTILSFGFVTNNALSAKSSVVFRGAIERLPSTAGDVGDAANVIVDSVDFHIPIRVLGSSTIYSDE